MYCFIIVMSQTFTFNIQILTQDKLFDFHKSISYFPGTTSLLDVKITVYIEVVIFVLLLEDVLSNWKKTSIVLFSKKKSREYPRLERSPWGTILLVAPNCQKQIQGWYHFGFYRFFSFLFSFAFPIGECQKQSSRRVWLQGSGQK